MKTSLKPGAYHLVFGLSLAALISLGAWWTLFIRYSVELEKNASLERLGNAAGMTAHRLGLAADAPAAGAIAGTDLEVIAGPSSVPGDMSVQAAPNHPGYSVRPASAAIGRIEKKAAGRRLMFIGEGSLLFLLLGVCVIMLHRLVRSDRRQIETMEQFVSAVTHEMKTPIAGLKSLLQTFASGGLPKEQEGELAAMGLKEAERLDHMVENVLISGRLGTERYTMEPEEVGLRSFLDAFIGRRRLFMAGGRSSISLVWEPAEAEIAVLCDRKALQVILENLADNAFKYGGERPEVAVRVKSGRGAISISVEDRGAGFDQKTAEVLFKPLARGYQQVVDARRGTGLGLSISRQLARRMGGDLHAESDGPGRGSAFTVSLKEIRR